MGEQERRTRLREFPAIAALLILAFGGYIKGSKYLAWMPIDMTLLAGAIVAVLLVHSWMYRSLEFRRAMLLALWGVSLTFGIFATGSAGNTYVSTKLQEVFLFVPLCVLGGIYLLRTADARRLWVMLIAGYGLLVLAVAWLDPSSLTENRLSLAGGNTIGAGRAAGASLIVFFLAALTERRFRMLWLALAAVSGYAGLEAASRGPLVAAAGAIVIAAVISRYRGQGKRAAVAVAAVTVATWWVLTSGDFNARLDTVDDTSASMRKVLWAQTWTIITHNPFGIGWGHLYGHFGFALLNSGYVQYPHNLVLEVFSEGGWIAGFLTIAILVVALIDQGVLAATNSTEMTMLALFVFALINAMVSGDVGANRGVWVSLGAALIPLIAGKIPSHSTLAGPERKAPLPAAKATATSG
ncbi:O-antigen ligase family protein [Rudaeicoccus suwonensis]|uniref:O-antigen ligase n=1 Tax=Rudaeicoccus suwonensis TaxID=657409 RepID=A0A561EBW4_9MICO|nr:O-antigen ligase family protein [Rudaeicoccus suwonensis]TWE13096.1 O-antigen ligase [Rudaeicoccus suwonensis]